MIAWSKAVAEGINEDIMRDALDITNHLGDKAHFFTLRSMLVEEGYTFDEVHTTIVALLRHGILLPCCKKIGEPSILKVTTLPAS